MNYGCNKLQPGGGGIRNKGFTLIELLSVIIILAVIALIAIPIILNIIEGARKSAFTDTAYGLIESAKLTYAENLIDEKTEVTTYEYPFEDLKFKGSKPSGGIVRIDKLGNVEIAIYNHKWCASKNKSDEKVKVTNYKEEMCIIQDSKKDPVITLNGASEIIVKQGESYIDLGVIAKTVDGEELKYTIEITLNGEKVEQIDTNIVGIYQITYQVSSNGKVLNITRTVKVEENKKTFEEVMRESQEVMRNDPDQNLRYVGPNPSNYVKFNNELWRVIGLFAKQPKIIRHEPYNRYIAWDKNSQNNWSYATLKEELNSTYLNSIESTSKSYIDSYHYWNLGGDPRVTDHWTRRALYISERRYTVYSGPTSWTGAIGLMYPSDYGYATSSTSSLCEETMYKWQDFGRSDCKDQNWLYDRYNKQWTLMPYSDDGDDVSIVENVGHIYWATVSSNTSSARPVLYLKSTIKIKSGDGTYSSPFELTQ